MLDIPGYQIRSKIYKSSKTVVYQGLRMSNQQRVIFKTLTKKYPTTTEIERLKHEYNLLRELNYPGVIRVLGMESYNNSPVLVMEDFGGESLSSLYERHQYSLIELLNLAIRIAEILGNIHEQNIIHKDINPTNIIGNPETDQIKIIDFGISIKLSRENLAIKNPNQLEGTLHYISPEQTGRMNRALDYRTDYYSLGVTFYQMFTGKLPFESNDPLELVHCHLAKMPVPPYKLDHKIPPVLSNIVMKLMAKTPEERYQGSYGLRKDLEKCLQALKNGKCDDFEIGMNDISEKFQVPEKLYGREKELSELLEVFDGVAKGNRDIMFFSGSPGIGKSALIYEIHKPIVERRGYFCSGKYDQYKRNIPYSAIINAFRELLKLFLLESEDKLVILKEEILEAVGSSGQVIIDVIAEVELVIGKQPEVQELPPVEAQNRFNMIFQNFVKVFARKEHPLVLFLDDLQWADSASLELIRVLLEDIELNYFLFISAYRDNEVDQDHPLSLMQGKMKKAGLSWKNIPVGPLKENHIGQLAVDTLHRDLEEVNELVILLLQKTGGNPFFLKEYLETLYERGLIEFEQALEKRKAGWTWDISRIQKAGITKNVVDLLAEKVKKLPENTWNVLKILCCMGEKSSLIMLASINGKSKEDTFMDLRQAIEEGIIILIDNTMKFVHDRVLEASYSLINEKERKEIHYTIGKKLLGETGEDIPEDSIFSIADQWNQAKELLNEKDKRQLLEINFKAGQKAKSSTAYGPAVNFFRQGAELLPGNPWEKDYQFTLLYYTEWSEAEYLARHVKEAERLFDTVLQHAREVLERIKIYSLQLSHYVAQSQFGTALSVGLKALRELDISMPGKPRVPSIIIRLLKAKVLSRKRKIEDWLNQPEMTDMKKLAAMDILDSCIPATVIGNPTFFPLFVLEMINLTFKYGNSVQSASAYSLYSIILLGTGGDINKGYKFGEISLKLADKSNLDVIKSITYTNFCTVVYQYKTPLKKVVELFFVTREYALNAGAFLHLGYIYAHIGLYLLFSGENLETIKTEYFQKYHKSVIKLNQPHITDYFNLFYQVVLNLLGETDEVPLIKGEFFNEEEIIPGFRETKNEAGLLFYYLFKQYVTYFSGKYSESLDFSKKSEEMVKKKVMPGSLPNLLLFFLYALNISYLYPRAGRKEKKKYLKKLRIIQKKYRGLSEHNKYTYLDKFLLISAEINRLTGKDMQETARLYNAAIQSAQENGIIFEEAIAYELATKYYLSLGQEKIAALYINEAHYCYMRWGCRPKVKQLEEEYPGWITGERRKKGRWTEDITITASTTGSLEALDLGTIIKASNTISREIRLEKLLKKMMHIVIENAGAQKGYFLLPREGEWFTEAEGAINQAEVKILQSISIKNIENNISGNIVKYVERTKETVVLNDAVHKGMFTEDEYIKMQKPKSVLCIPLLNQGKLSGILYMENNLTTGAFTPDRLGVLNTLSSQIAISIENARIYQDLDELNKNLEQKVEERTWELKEKNEQVLDSIYYSKRIQAAIMPPEEKLKTALPEHFVLFLPRDIVSGDFYWFSEVDNNIIFAVVDCTGHGVPGALLSMMGDIFLKEIVNIDGIIEPAKILRELHKKVRTHLRQEEEKAETMDGMDVCLCRIEKEKGRVHFAGAKRPLYIVRENNADRDEDISRLIEIRGDKKSIGGRQKEITRTYTTKEIEVQKGDMIYLTSDGFADQPDTNIKKYGSKRLKALLPKIAKFPMKKQKKYLEEELKAYQDTEKQRDDITIAGIRM